jgi:hypothetical protein
VERAWQPSHDRAWIPELARLPSIAREGDIGSPSPICATSAGAPRPTTIERWETRRYDLTKVEGADLYLSYWSGEAIAHLLVSFPFRRLSRRSPSPSRCAARRARNGRRSPASSAVYEMAYVATARARSRRPAHPCAQARMSASSGSARFSPAQARDVLLAYVADVNELAGRPRWYNTLTTNCTTVVYTLVGSVAPAWKFSLPLDPRVLLSGFLPGYLQRIGAVRSDIPLDELVRQARIGERARTISLDDPDFSKKIREGVPTARP